MIRVMTVRCGDGRRGTGKGAWSMMGNVVQGGIRRERETREQTGTVTVISKHSLL